MNIIKIQNQLKGVPDDTLVGYVQNPTGQVPTYLALSELQRRKEMRSSYQANKPEEKSVAEDLVAEAQPQPGIAALPEAQPMMEAMAPQPEMPMEQMAQGGLTDLAMDNQMFNEENFASGGIVAFAEGGASEDKQSLYGIDMPVVPAWDDLKMDQLRAYEQYGVDPDFYKKTLEESKTERLKDLEESKKMDQAQLLLAMGSAFAGTPTFGKALSVAGERAAPIVGAMGKNQREINNMYKMADRKSLEAQQAQARGDAQGAVKAMEERKNILLNAQIERAKIGATISKASSTAKRDLYNKARDNAQNAMRDQFTGGLAAAPFFGDQAKWEAEVNKKVNNELEFLAAEYGVDKSELKSFSNPSVSASTTAKPAADAKTAKPAADAKAAPAAKPKPTQADIDYVTAHPELRDRFKARFGIDAPSLVNQIPR
jgi:hypothetical protein